MAATKPCPGKPVCLSLPFPVPALRPLPGVEGRSSHGRGQGGRGCAECGVSGRKGGEEAVGDGTASEPSLQVPVYLSCLNLQGTSFTKQIQRKIKNFKLASAIKNFKLVGIPWLSSG